MKMIYVVGQDQNGDACRYFKIVGTEKEAKKIEFVADFMVDAYYDKSINMAFIEVGDSGITEQKKFIKLDYAAAKEAWKKAQTQAPEKTEEAQAPALVTVNKNAIISREKAQAPAKVKRVRRRNRQMVKAVKMVRNTPDAYCRGMKSRAFCPSFETFAKLRDRKRKTMDRLARQGKSFFADYFTPFYNVA